MTGIISVVLAYLLGGIPFGLIIVRLTTGADVRQSGSGNIGATNVLRTTGRGAGFLTLFLDAAKGWFAVWLADYLTHGDAIWISFAALAVMLGHVFSPYLKFKGGKAVASFLGAFLYLTPIPTLVIVVIFVIVVAMTRYLSLGSISGAILFPFACFIILHPEWHVLVAATGASLLVLWRHKENFARLREGRENLLNLGKRR